MDYIAPLAAPPIGQVPIFLPGPRPADLVEEIRDRLTRTTDVDHAAELLTLGLDVLRRRQAQREGGRR